MVAVATRARVGALERSRGVGWTLGALAVLLLGLGLRAALGGAGVGDRSAMVMTALLGVGAWAAARLFRGPRVAFLAALGVVALLDLAALPQRNPPPYDDLEAFYRTDQQLTTRVAIPDGAQRGAVLTLLAQPTFGGAQAKFGLAGSVAGAPLSWTCEFGRGIQTLALPLPTDLVHPGETVDLQLHLSGSPSRESDYLVVYASSERGGYLVAIAPADSVDAGATRCALA